MNPKLSALVIASALLLTACPATPAPGPQPVTSVSGTVVVDTATELPQNLQPWTAGAGTVVGEVDSPASSTSVKVADGTLAASGAFTLPLPASVDSANLAPFSATTLDATNLYQSLSGAAVTCTDTPKFSSTTVRGAPLSVGVATPLEGALLPLVETYTETDTQITIDVKFGGLVYVDAPLKVTGTFTCTSAATGYTVSGTVRWNATFVKGWNKLAIAERISATAAAADQLKLDVTVTTGTLPSDKWVFQSNSATPLGLSAPGRAAAGLPGLHRAGPGAADALREFLKR